MNPFAKLLKYPVRGLSGLQPAPTWDRRLRHMKELGFAPHVVYDCGAYIGGWTKAVTRIFPGAQTVLCEPNRDLLSKIKENIASIEPPPVVLNVAVSDRRGTACLNIWGNKHTSAAGSSFLAHVQGDATTQMEVPAETIDGIADRTGYTPDLLKLDLQGTELAALMGATTVLGSIEAVIVEFGCLDAYVNRTSPREIIDLLYDRGFRLYDIVDLHYRPYDGALTGGDFFFVKEDSPLKAYKGYT